MSRIPLLGEKKKWEGRDLHARMCRVCGTAPPEYKTGTDLSEPVGVQGKLLHKHSANNKMFQKALKLNGLRC